MQCYSWLDAIVWILIFIDCYSGLIIVAIFGSCKLVLDGNDRWNISLTNGLHLFTYIKQAGSKMYPQERRVEGKELNRQK
jgi:hypothetical protein